MAPHPVTDAPAVDSATSIAVTGLHILANFSVQNSDRLVDYRYFKSFIDLLIEEFKLSKVGEVYENLATGFTGVVSFTESHLSIHTYPDQGHLTFDVFLSNHERYNEPTAHALYHSVRHFFHGKVTFEQIVKR